MRTISVDINKDLLVKMYIEEEKSLSQISKELGCSVQAVFSRMNLWGIPKRSKSQAASGKLNPVYGMKHSEETKLKMSESYRTGKRTIGLSTNWGKSVPYDTPNQGTVFMRSRWERNVADYLTLHSINWLYESSWLDLGDTSYLPDFYLPDYGFYIEVKGRSRHDETEKIQRASKLGIKVLLWDGIELLKRGIIRNCGDAKLNKVFQNYTPAEEDLNAEIPYF